MSWTPARGPPLRRLAVAAGVVVLAVAAPASALAHATVVRSDPADGSSVEQGPRAVRIWFDEGIVPRFSDGEILGSRGRSVPLKSVRAEADGLLVLTPAARLDRGLYTAEWAILSAEDGHIRRGFVVFAVGPDLAPAAAGDRRDESVAPVDVALRWLNFSVLAALAGGLAMAFLLQGAEAREARRRLLGWMICCAALGLVVGAGHLIRQAAELAAVAGRGESLPAVLVDFAGGTRLGALWLLRETLLLALVALLFGLRRPGRSGLWAATAAFVLALAVVQALSGHAAATSPGTGLVVAAAALHLLAAGVWIGGLAAAIVAFWPFGEQRWSLARASLRRFGVMAGLSVGVLGITGLYYAGRQVASVDALLTTLYGQVLLVKVAVLAVAGACGLMTMTLVHPRAAAPAAAILGRPAGWTPLPARLLRPLLLAEVSAGLLVLAAAAVLTATLPARGPEFARAARGAPADVRSSLSATVKDVLVTLSVKPNRTGPNVFQVIAASARRPAPADIKGVTLRFRRAGGATVSAPMFETEPGRFRLAGNQLTSAGAWRIQVAVERGGPANVVGSFDWRTAPPEGRRPFVSDRPLEPFLVGASAVGLVLLLAVAVGLIPTRRSASRWKREPVRTLRGSR